MIDLSSRSTEKKMKLVDTALGVTVVFSWRIPTTMEQVAYRTEKYRAQAERREGPALEHGLAILTGIRDGDFSMDGKPLSSDPASPDFRSDWKDALKGNPVAAKMIGDLAVLVFEGSYALAMEDSLPFGKS